MRGRPIRPTKTVSAISREEFDRICNITPRWDDPTAVPDEVKDPIERITYCLETRANNYMNMLKVFELHRKAWMDMHGFPLETTMNHRRMAAFVRVILKDLKQVLKP